MPRKGKKKKQVVQGGQPRRSRKQRSMRPPAPVLANGQFYNAPYGDFSSNSLAQKMVTAMREAAASPQRYSSVLDGLAPSGLIPYSSGNFYLDSLSDPFRPEVRLPDKFSRPSATHKSKYYGTLTSDATVGTGAIIMNPYLGDGTSTPVRSRWLVEYSGATATFREDPDRATIVAMVNGIRPVSAGIFISFCGDTFNDGGQIAAAWLPGDTTAAQITAYTSNVGQLATVPGAYVGPISKGVYINWRPDDNEDYEFLTPTNALAHNYPILLVSFTSTQLNKVVLRYSAHTNYEITTNSGLKPVAPSPVIPRLVDQACQVLALVPAACPNDEHVNWWGRILTGARDFFSTIGNGIRDIFSPSLSDIVGNAATVGSNPGLMNIANTYLGGRQATMPA